MNGVSIEDLLSGKVRLEFGNLGQLTAIRMYEKQQEEILKQCQRCNGGGEISCPDCDGTGEAKPT